MVLVAGVLEAMNALSLLAWSPCPFACLSPEGLEACAFASDTLVEPLLSLFALTDNRPGVFDPLSPAKEMLYP